MDIWYSNDPMGKGMSPLTERVSIISLPKRQHHSGRTFSEGFLSFTSTYVGAKLYPRPEDYDALATNTQPRLSSTTFMHFVSYCATVVEGISCRYLDIEASGCRKDTYVLNLFIAFSFYFHRYRKLPRGSRRSSVPRSHSPPQILKPIRIQPG
ncbi:uncharacterized protein BT62DRAFT_260854 [Guyanagaster necrorhizus]|uniref:Uncharacterized protein n=1 Tax=Guyanagaster necrorhizus TaxID=856835 RepID=A0A9P7VPI8_9AGAR|nr:uncharacterized protein BT62DRAFT_260854 [Guyanagaster necrorhizus MCA 3950]KAG7444237.1 hypothetical protein BT62DRAFT_260854 [Guyanagaster necrorhizus MCA 3950]